MTKTEKLINLSGVSRSTVFRFLRGDSIRQDTKNRILSAMQQLDILYERPLREKTGSLIISIRPDFNYFKGYGLSIMGFMNQAELYGYTVQLQTEQLNFPERSNTSSCAGVLILGKTIDDEEHDIALLKKAGIPHVLVNRMFDDNSISWVSVDIQKAAKDAVAHLIELGHREIGTWGATGHYRIDRDKRKGYEEAFREKSLPVPASRFDDASDGVIEEVIQRLIDENRLPPAWFAASDEVAMRLAKVVRENGLSIPEDIALVGMDDVNPAAYMNPSLTSIHIPYQDAGAAAMDVLQLQINNPGNLSHRIVLKHRLVIRESCGAKARGREL
ncbi:LacI family DNA-binding transcriptional regulator [Marispirochaeta sp.]|uniref:LacI family DNA-binding transcriptional regulator n=1 Tax=Marispirochaeta sp. TaxID=2038653 RepID=UPI0029C7F7F9|nr:LacI family DNA-binding transcriptional regulator [Marispirochaeta sp.]